MNEYDQNLQELRKSVEKNALLFILRARIDELQDELEDINLAENLTNAIRGGILEIRNLIDLVETPKTSSQDD